MAREKIKFENRDEIYPLCSSCGGELKKVSWHRVKGIANIGYVVAVSCPQCRRIISFIGG